MPNSFRGKVLAVLAALGLGAGITFVLTKNGCTVKSVTPPPVVSTDAGGAAGT